MPQISLFDSETDSRPKPVEISWENLSAALAEVRYTECTPCLGKDCPQKAGRAWSPVTFVEGAARADTNVVSVNLAVFDFDDVSADQLEGIGDALAGYSYLVHQTHRGNGYRLVMPLASPVPAAQWPAVWAGMQEKFGFKDFADQKCGNTSRLYFTPSRPQGGGFELFEGDGEVFDWTEVAVPFDSAAGAVKMYATAATAESHAIAARVFNTGPIDREGRLKLKKFESAVLMARVFKGEALAPSGARDNTINQAMSVLAQFGEQAYAPELVAALVEPSIRAMPCDPEGVGYWLQKAADCYLRALERRAEREAREGAMDSALMKVLTGSPGPGVPAPDAEKWRARLLTVLGKDGEPGGLRQSGANAFLIMQNDAAWRGTIRFNEVTKDIEIHGGPMEGKPRASLEVYASNWFAESEYKLHLSPMMVAEQILAVARENGFDPIADYLNSLTWDGTERISNFFGKYMSAAGNQEHIARVSRCFLISLVARAMHPGCDVQTVPILRGGQGVGKSRSLRALGGAFFSDTKLDIRSHDARLVASSTWLIELGELASLKGADMEAVKGFVSAPSDKFRPPYGRAPEVFYRRAVFAGSTNRREFLEDDTGLRRWWPIEVGACDVEGVARDRDQLFAEAVVAYRAGEKWFLSAEAAKVAENEADQFSVTSIHEEQIVSWFNKQPIHERPAELTVYEIATRVFGMTDDRLDSRAKQVIGYAIARLGFIKARKRSGGKQLWYYKTPDDIMKAQRETKPRSTNLNVVPPEDQEKAK